MGNSSSAPGVYATEKRAGVPAIKGLPASIGGFIVRTQRGPTKVIRCSSFPQFQRIFGSYDINSYGAESVKGFFDNGGSACYIQRVLGSSSGSNAKASVAFSSPGAPSPGSLNLSPSDFPFVVPSGTSVTGNVDGVALTPFSFTGTKSTITGSAGTFAAVTANHVLTLIVTGKYNGFFVVKFSGSEAALADFVTKINASIGFAVAEDDGTGQLKLVSSQQGLGAQLTISGVGSDPDVLTSLGLTAGAGTTGTGNVADVNQIEGSELASLFQVHFGSTATASWSPSAGFTFTSLTKGASSSINLTGSVTFLGVFSGAAGGTHSGSDSASALVATFSSIGEGSDNNNYSILPTPINARIGIGIPTLVAAGTITHIDVTAAVAGRVSPGDTLLFKDGVNVARGIVASIAGTRINFTGNVTVGVGSLTTTGTQITLETFSIDIYYAGTKVAPTISGLRMSPLSQRDYFATRINTDNVENLFTVVDGAASFTGLDLRPAATNTTIGDAMTGGSEATTFADADWIGDQTTLTGLYGLDKIQDVRLLAIPGITGITPGAVTKALIQYCENRNDVLAIVTPPLGTDAAAKVTFKRDHIGSSSFGAMYAGYVYILSPLTGQKALSPPEGYVMGMMSKCIQKQGVQKAPAGESTGKLVGTLGVEEEFGLDDRGILNSENIDVIENIPNVGQCVMGSRTMEDGEFNQIHVRNTFIYLRTSMQVGTRWVVFEENTPETRSKLSRQVAGFLEGEWRKGTLTGDTLDQAFWLKCDGDNNPPELVAMQQMLLETGVNIPKTVEILNIVIQNDQRGQGPAVAA